MFRALAIISILAIPTASNAADLWSGEYSGDCGRSVQCETAIQNGGSKVVDVAFMLSAPLDAQDIKCKIEGKFTKASASTLKGAVENAAVTIKSRPNGEITVSGLSNNACNAKLNGEYVQFGDY